MLRFKTTVWVEAAQWDGTVSGAVPIIRWILDNKGVAKPHNGDSIEIETSGGIQYAYQDFWIVRGPEGGFYPVEPNQFEEEYEVVYSDPSHE